MRKHLARNLIRGADSSQILAEEITKNPGSGYSFKHPGVSHQILCRVKIRLGLGKHPGHIGESLTANRVARLARPDGRLSHQAQVSPVGDSSDHRRNVCERVEGIDLTH